MAAQDVRELIPRVRRAIEGPAGVSTGALSDDQVLALAADSISDIILFTVGRWGHALLVTHRATGNIPDEWAVDPGLEPQEESVVAAQAGITFFFHTVTNKKISESIQNEGQTWDYQLSATVLRDQVKLLQDQRDRALEALMEAHPVLARYASILAVRDRVGAAILEPFTFNGGTGIELGGGMEQNWLPQP